MHAVVLLPMATWLLGTFAGCHLLGRHEYWREPALAAPLDQALACEVPAGTEDRLGGLRQAECCYARGWEHELAGHDRCVDDYCSAALHAWPLTVEAVTWAAQSDPWRGRARDLYHSALVRMLVSAQSFGRYRPGTGLCVQGPGGPCVLGVTCHGFPWTPADFATVLPAGDYATPRLERQHGTCGVGVPLVAFSGARPRPYMQAHQAFAATAVLRPMASSHGRLRACCLHGLDPVAGITESRQTFSLPTTPSISFPQTPPGSAIPPPDVVRLEFYNPLTTPGRLSCHPATEGNVPLATDQSAPLAYRLINTPSERWLSFLRPEDPQAGENLFMIEPYQPGKVPLVFIHGLLSDTRTWASLANDLRAERQLVDGYQLWTFQYPTGQGFLRSAARLRQLLTSIRHELDPHCQDSALDRMVLVGHSMGGLIAKLQVASSGCHLWNAVARQPLPEICTDPATRAELVRLFLFEPLPTVERVVFLGTPHRGSTWARRLIGRLGAVLVKEPPEQVRRHRQLVDQNPGVFSREMRRRIPTSVDLLSPDSELLAAIGGLPVARHVHLHSIIGTGRPMPCNGPADGIVPVWSARIDGVDSELFVPAIHTELHRRTETVAEVVAILREHLHRARLAGRSRPADARSKLPACQAGPRVVRETVARQPPSRRRRCGAPGGWHAVPASASRP
jgi:pimeloyl-ACP methyl ester carboxylesterase